MEEAFASPMQGFAPSGHRARPLWFIELCLLACLLANILCEYSKYLFIFFEFSCNLCKNKKSAEHSALSLHYLTKKSYRTI